MTPDITICSHSWNYSRCLAYQLSSLVIWPPRSRVQVVICFTRDGDDKTAPMLDWFIQECRLPANVSVVGHEMERPRLLRRAIGRNEVALEQQARVAWFADVDYIFGPGCLDYIAANFPADANLTWPRYVYKCSHARGDELIGLVKRPGLFRFPFEEAKPARPRRAVGGIQIVRGEHAREVGYLKDSRRYQKPADVWRRTHEDPKARKTFLPGVELDVPSVGRVRHSQYGRQHIGCEN